MANEYTTVLDILRNPIGVRKERYGAVGIKKLIIDDEVFGGYKAYSSFWEKTYPEEPERSTGGVIDNLNSQPTFITFHVKVDFAMMSIDDYRRLYKLLLDRNEFTVTAYDVLSNKPYTCKMYFAPDQMPTFAAFARKIQGEEESFVEVIGVRNYTIELIGTNADIDLVEIRYYDKDGNIIPQATQSVYKGVETVVNYKYIASSPYRFDGKWRREDGGVVSNGTVLTPQQNIKLTAIVVDENQYTLSLDYGLGKKPTTAYADQQVDSFTIVTNQKLGNSIENAGVLLENGNIFTFPTQGTGMDNVIYNNKEYKYDSAYKFDGWGLAPVYDSQKEVNSDTVFDYGRNRTIYQIYSKKSYSISFNTNDTSIKVPSKSVLYGENVSVPTFIKNGKTTKWYWDDDGKEVAFNGIMPPFNINIYAKWE